MTAEPIIAVDELRGHMRRRGSEASELVVDLDAEGGVIVRARFEPDGVIVKERTGAHYGDTWPRVPVEPDPDLIGNRRPAPTAQDIAKAVSHEQGMNVWKGLGLVAFLAFLVFVAGALGWI